MVPQAHTAGKLTPTQRAFIAAWAATLSWQTAADFVHVPLNRARHWAFSCPTVKEAFIERVERSIPDKVGLRERIIRELEAIAFADYTDIVDPATMTIKPGMGKLVNKVRMGKAPSIELFDKQRALELLGKFLGMWQENVNNVQVNFTSARPQPLEITYEVVSERPGACGITDQSVAKTEVVS